MDINTAIEAARELVRQGDTDKALQTLLGVLEKDSRYAEAARILQVVEANYNAARQQEVKGILSFQEAQRLYSQVNDALISSLDALAAGRTPRPIVAEAAKSNRLYWLIGGAIVLLLGLIAGILLTNRNRDKETAANTAAAESKCPDFNTNDFRIMLLPFQNLGRKSDDASPELAIQTRIRDLTGKNDLKADVEVFAHETSKGNTPDVEDAAGIGRECDAHMVIWGEYDYSKDLNVDVRYVFTKGGLRQGAIGSLVFKDVAALKSGTMFRDLDDAILSLCSFIALRNERPELAKKWMEKIKIPNEGDKEILTKIGQVMERAEEMKKQKNGN